jgi:DNA-directed RNA polymerase subunit RPC12/RpoP
MKAITCTQCGATLENVSERSVIIECEYCGARIMMAREEAETRVKPKPPVVQVEPPELDVEATRMPPFVTVGVVAALALILPTLLVFFASTRSNKKMAEAASVPAYSTPYTSGTPSSWSWKAGASTPEKPVPVVNYQPRVAWDGPDDMEYFADPEVDVSSLSDKTSEEVEKIVFKNRVVKLRVVINTQGQIDEVETISGHPILVQAATESAKRSIFSSRSKPTKRVLTYTFRVLKD